jgi:hypothetical protein
MQRRLHGQRRRAERGVQPDDALANLSDLQRYADSIVGAPATRARRLRALKSLLSFAAKLGLGRAQTLAGERAEGGEVLAVEVKTRFGILSTLSGAG